MTHDEEIQTLLAARDAARAEAQEERMLRHRDLCLLALDWSEAATDAAIRAGNRIHQREKAEAARVVTFPRDGGRAIERVRQVLAASGRPEETWPARYRRTANPANDGGGDAA